MTASPVRQSDGLVPWRARTGGRLTFYPGDYESHIRAHRPDRGPNLTRWTAERFHRFGGAWSWVTGTKAQKRLEAETRNAIARARREKEKRVHELEMKIAPLEGQQRELAATWKIRRLTHRAAMR